jgi:hypothetical protein
MSEPGFTTLLLIVTGAFLAAGFVKGAVGMGLPTISIGLLSLGGMGAAQAASVMVGPALVTNLWQAFAGPALRPLLRRFWSMLALTFAGTLAGSGVMAAGNARLAVFALGIVLFVSTAINLLAVRFHVPRRREWWLSPLVGIVTGLITGATGAFIFPAIPYMGALELSRDELIQLLGVSAIVSSVALGFALWWRGSFGLPLAGTAAFALLPAFAGMFFGQKLRRHISEKAFRNIFQVGMLLLGAWLALKNIP